MGGRDLPSGPAAHLTEARPGHLALVSFRKCPTLTILTATALGDVYWEGDCKVLGCGVSPRAGPCHPHAEATATPQVSTRRAGLLRLPLRLLPAAPCSLASPRLCCCRTPQRRCWAGPPERSTWCPVASHPPGPALRCQGPSREGRACPARPWGPMSSTQHPSWPGFTPRRAGGRLLPAVPEVM